MIINVIKLIYHLLKKMQLTCKNILHTISSALHYTQKEGEEDGNHVCVFVFSHRATLKIP